LLLARILLPGNGRGLELVDKLLFHQALPPFVAFVVLLHTATGLFQETK